MMNFRRILQKNKLFTEYVRIMNGVFGLSQREAEVYSLLLEINHELRRLNATKFKSDILSKENRRVIMRECNMSKSNLSRNIIKFKSMGLLKQDVDRKIYYIPEYISPKLTGDHTIEVTFTLSTIPDEETGSSN